MCDRLNNLIWNQITGYAMIGTIQHRKGISYGQHKEIDNTSRKEKGWLLLQFNYRSAND